MTTKHTPGPWHRNIRANGKYPTVFAGRNQHVAVVKQQGDPSETEANIDLVAAAPELLAALQKAVRFGGLFPDLRVEAEAAIAKATGE